MEISDEMDVVETLVDNKIRADLPFVEKYRPKDLDQLIAHEDIINILNQLISSNKLPHLLFYGPPGTGKTSTIQACAKKMYGEQHYRSMILELNASDDRGIDAVRDQIKSFAQTQKLWSSGVKLIILDEADAMTGDAQAALRRVIEKYTSNTRFCLICNYVNKIIPALQSRCTRFRFSPLKPDQISSRLNEIAIAENINATEDGKSALMQLAAGDMRRVLNLLQSTSMAFPIVNQANVYQTAGAALPEVIDSILKSLLNDNYQESFQFIYKITTDFGYALVDIIREISLLISKKDLPDEAMGYIMDNLSNIEFRLSHGSSDRLQLGAFIGTFVIVRKMISPV